MKTPRSIRPDLAHTYAIAGWGKHFAASGVITLLRLGVFGHAKIQVCLQTAYNRFRDWCSRNRKSTSISDFELTSFKVSSCLRCN